MRRKSASWLVRWVSRLVEGRGKLAIYGLPGSCRTRLALAASARLGRVLYIGAGRHSRLSQLPPGAEHLGTTSFYEELLNVIKALSEVEAGIRVTVVLDEFMANLAPYRALMNESCIMRMALTEVHLLEMLGERGGRVLLVCGEDPRTGGPLGLRYLRVLRPPLLRMSVEEDALIVEERDLADPTLALSRHEVLLREILGEGGEELSI